MTSLFDAFDLSGVPLRNRVVMAPMTRSRSPNAIPTADVARYYAQRASAGLIVSEGVAISHQGQGYVDVPGLYTPEALAGWRVVTDAVHAKGGKIVAQLWHVGRLSHVALLPAGQVPVGPSAILSDAKTFLRGIPDQPVGLQQVSMPRALGVEELPSIVQEFRAAARAAVDSGFDGVEIHGANGYLLDQFLRAGANQRTDAYGGSFENRARFMLEVVDAVAAEVGASRTGIRISPVMNFNGLTDPDPQPLFEHVVRGFASRGLSYVHVAEMGAAQNTFDWDALRQAYRDAGGQGAWIVNAGYDKARAEAALNKGADLVAFGTPFIANPDFVERLKEGVPLAEMDPATTYGEGPEGYVNYPDRNGQLS